MNREIYNNILNYCRICEILLIFLATAGTEIFDVSNSMLKFVRDCNATANFLDGDGGKASCFITVKCQVFTQTQHIFYSEIQASYL
jgi:hypothetical protein